MPLEAPAGGAPEALQIPFTRIAAFVRQVTHDVRNNLNSMDLQAAYAGELVNDPEAAAEVKRIRAIIQTSARHLQALSSNFQTSTPHPVSYQAAILVEDLRDRVGKAFTEDAAKIAWAVSLDAEMLDVDVEMFFSALVELFRNAIQFRTEEKPIEVTVKMEGDHFALTICEVANPPSTPPETWGTEPFVSSRRSGYGLGLFRVRRLLSMHGGYLAFSYDSGSALLRTRVLLPLAPPT